MQLTGGTHRAAGTGRGPGDDAVSFASQWLLPRKATAKPSQCWLEPQIEPRQALVGARPPTLDVSDAYQREA
ncbi:hypothetical protein GCM10028796_22600 [Ramlibacter monticola]